MNLRPRRTRSGPTALVAIICALGLFAAACVSEDDDAATSTSAGDTSSGEVLDIAFLGDMGAPDPDVYYGGEGLTVMLAVYERLIDYAPDSNEYAPLLAESWEVSDDGLTYTFNLRPGVKFHDGTDADAEAWVSSFERCGEIDQGMSYMVADVVETAAPDPTTFVVTLGTPNNAFLDYMASPWGPYAVSPTAVAENEVDGDLAQGFFETSDAGTGPYTISSWDPSSGYTLEAFPDYWGEQPEFTTVNVSIIPESSNQRLQLENGDLDLITRGLSPEDLAAFDGNEDVEVSIRPEPPGFGVWLNTSYGPMTDPAVREAVVSALDRETIVESTYGDEVPVLDSFFSAATVPDGLTPLEIDYDPTKLEALVPEMEDTSLVLGYREASGAPYRRMAELIGAQLDELGLEVTVQAVPSAEEYEIATNPPESRPDLLLTEWGGGDGLHPDMMLRIFLRTDAVPLNWFNYSNPSVDADMDAAVAEPTREDADEIYQRISETVQADSIVVPLGQDVARLAYSSGLSNVVSNTHKQNVIYLAQITSA